MKTIALLVCALLVSCTVNQSLTELPPKTVPVANGQSIFVQLGEGEIRIHGGETGQVRVSGEARFPEHTEYSPTTVNDQIQITVNYTGSRLPDPSIHLDVSVPSQVPLKIETESASIKIDNYEGEIEAASVSGDIAVSNLKGVIIARSNRGDINVKDSLGKISVVGNYGPLTVEDTRGNIGVSTIMGTITFRGSVLADDNVRLETDHGPVVVNLNSDSSLSLQARSTSGEVACMLPRISTTLRTCEGTLNSGDGALNIRTVSGAVTVQLIP